MTQRTSDFLDLTPDPYFQWNDLSQWHTRESTPIEPAPTPGIFSSAASNPSSGNHSPYLSQPQPHTLLLLQWDEWDENCPYNEDPPSCIHYSIEWRVTLNSRVVSKDTEQDLVLSPNKHWEMFLRPKLAKLLDKKFSRRRVEIDDTSIVVSISDRNQRDLVRRFDEMEIDWSVVENQLVKWSELFRAGKKLRLVISFNYTESSHPSTSHSRRTDKRGGYSVTQRMLDERATQLDAEEDSLGQPSVWREVYNLMRCPGPPCQLGPHCWRDPIGKKHYRLGTHHLQSLIRYVEQGGKLQCHEDVPNHIREQLYAEDQKRLQRRQKGSALLSASCPPISITNVLSGQSPQSFHQATSDETSGSAMLTRASSLDRLNIPGLRDVAVTEYTDWQQSKVRDLTLKSEFQKAGDIALADGLDLEQVYEDQNPDFFVRRGVKIGIARRFVGDIRDWVKHECEGGAEDL